MKKILSFLFVLFFASGAFAPPINGYYTVTPGTIASCESTTECYTSTCKTYYEYVAGTPATCTSYGCCIYINFEDDWNEFNCQGCSTSSLCDLTKPDEPIE